METIIKVPDAAADTAAHAPGHVMDLDWEFIKAQLPDDWRELADQMGLIRPHPPHLHAKITDIEQVLRLELQRVALESSLVITTARSRAVKKLREDDGGVTTGPSAPVDISGPSLHGWERKLGPGARLAARALHLLGVMRRGAAIRTMLDRGTFDAMPIC